MLFRHLACALLLLLLLLAALPRALGAVGEPRTNLVQAILSEDAAEQIELIRKLNEASDPLIEQALAAWRLGSLFLLETNDTRTPFFLDAQTDSDGKARAIRVADGEFIKDSSGQPLAFMAGELTPVDTTSKLRKAIKT